MTNPNNTQAFAQCQCDLNISSTCSAKMDQQVVDLYLPVPGGWMKRPAVQSFDFEAAAVFEDNMVDEQLIFVADSLGVLAYRLINRGVRWARTV